MNSIPSAMRSPIFLNEDLTREVRRRFGSPVYVYDQATLEQRAHEVLAFPNLYGMTARYAMKASPSAAIVQALARTGLHIDASSGFEAERAMLAGVPAERIQLTAQQLPANLDDLIAKGVRFNACSLHQLASYGKRFPGTNICIRVNPGLGSGSNNRTNVGGPASSFGIWHGHLDRALETARHYGLRITRLHTHIGSGSDPEIWLRCARLSLGIAARLPDVSLLSLGGGFKVARMPGEPSADLHAIGRRILSEFEAFAASCGRRLHLEIEPGTYLVANAGALVCSVIDVVDTGDEGYRFIKVDAGMTELLRPSLYGAQHPIVSVSAQPRSAAPEQHYVVVGHCCESGDIFTPEPGNPEGLHPRKLRETVIDDLLVIGGAGAYGSAMAAKNYNSFPECAEVMLTKTGDLKLIRARQTLEQMLQNEVS